MFFNNKQKIKRSNNKNTNEEIAKRLPFIPFSSLNFNCSPHAALPAWGILLFNYKAISNKLFVHQLEARTECKRSKGVSCVSLPR